MGYLGVIKIKTNQNRRIHFQILNICLKQFKTKIVQVTFLTFGIDDIHQNHEMIENHIFI